MNLLRTIQAQEDPEWVELFFTEGPHEGDCVPYGRISFHSHSSSKRTSWVALLM
jgi:hypothetical protein